MQAIVVGSISRQAISKSKWFLGVSRGLAKNLAYKANTMFTDFRDLGKS